MTPDEKPNDDTQDVAPPERARSRSKKEVLEQVRERRLKAGAGDRYYYAALRNDIPMVFRRFDGQDILGILLKDGGYTFTVKTAQGRRVVRKIELQFAYRAGSLGAVHQAIGIDERVKSLANPPLVKPTGRYEVPDETLQRCQEEGSRLRLTMRGGEVLEGRIEWFGGYDIKLDLATGKSVVVFRHAVYSHAVITENKG